MKKIIFLFIISFTLIGTISSQQTVAGVNLPKKVKIGKTELGLNGSGVRQKMWIDLYVCGLYLKAKNTDANKIINANEHASLKLHIVSKLITSEKMIDAVEEGFKNSTDGKTKPIRKEIDTFKAVFSKEEIKKNDVYDIVYVPSKGTVIFKNGKIQPIIEGLAFKKALFGIWLCDKPADKDLKVDLLNKE